MEKPIDNPLDKMAEVFMNVDENGNIPEVEPELTMAEQLADGKLDTDERSEDDEGSIQEQIRGEDNADDAVDPAEAPEPELVDFDSLSETLKLPKEDVYKIPIPLGDERDPIPLGKLKDQYVEAERFKERQQEMTEQLADQQNDLMAKRREVDSLMQALGPQLDNQTRDYINQQSQESIARERKQVIQSIPEWSDAKTVAADLEAITDFAGGYGYSATEINNIVDHRLFKMLRDVSLGHKRVKEARKGKAVPKAQPPKRTESIKGASLSSLVERSKKTGSKDDKANAMLAVLGANE